MSSPLLLAVPNVSEGTRPEVVAAIGRAIARAPIPDDAPRLLDTHFDRDHDRAVFTIAGRPGSIADAVLRLAREAVERIDVIGNGSGGQHPHVGAIDVAPVVYLRPEDRGAACAEALVIADRIGSELEVPVFLYGELTADEDVPERTRQELRRGGPAVLAARMDGSDPASTAETPCARTSARPGCTRPRARRSSPHAPRWSPSTCSSRLPRRWPTRAGSPSRSAKAASSGCRACGRSRSTSSGVPQVSMNVERPLELPLAEIVRAVARHAPIASAQLVGLAPRAAFDGFPADLPLPGFVAERHLIENALGTA